MKHLLLVLVLAGLAGRAEAYETFSATPYTVFQSSTVCIDSAPHKWEACEWETTPEEWRETVGYWLEIMGEKMWIEDKKGSERLRKVTTPAIRKVTRWLCVRCWRKR